MEGDIAVRINPSIIAPTIQPRAMPPGALSPTVSSHTLS